MTDVIFVHGAWVGPQCWDRWRQRLSKQGVTSHAPPWPFDNRPYSQLRSAPDPQLAGLGVGEIVEHYARIIEAMPAPPILIGHSFGGLIVQLLLSRGLGAAGVAVNPGPPRGVFPTPRALLSALPVLLHWRGWKKVLTMTYKQFVSGFVHQLTPDERRFAYDDHVIPTPGRIYFQAAFAPFQRVLSVDFKKSDRAPLLLIAGDRDRTAPAPMVRANHRAYRRSSALTDLREFVGRSHWIIAEPGWEEVCDYAISWARRSARSKAIF